MTIKVNGKEAVSISMWELSKICEALVAIAVAFAAAKKASE